jgi:hypothetical protein
MVSWIVLAVLTGTIGVLLLVRRRQLSGGREELAQQAHESKTG